MVVATFALFHDVLFLKFKIMTLQKADSIVPTIDVASYLKDPSSSEAKGVVDAVRDACKKTGFFQVTGHGLSPKLQKELLAASEKFFSLGYNQKRELDARTTVGRRGYDVLASQAYDDGSFTDLKEGFYVGHNIPLYDEVVKQKRFFMGPNVWPNASILSGEEFRRPVEAYFHAIHGLSLSILKLVAATLPYGPDVFKDVTVGHTVAVLRMLHYPPMPPTQSLEGRKQFGAGAQTDFGAITLLLQDDNPGLEVLDPETNDFVAVDPSPNAFVFNVGDMLSFWTSGEYKSSVHRVINKAPRDRYSAAFFYDGSLDCPLVPLDESNKSSGGGDVLTVEKHMIKRITESYGAKTE